MFSCHSESSQNTCSERDRSNDPGNRFESGDHYVFRFADLANVGKSLLDGTTDHLRAQAHGGVADTLNLHLPQVNEPKITQSDDFEPRRIELDRNIAVPTL